MNETKDIERQLSEKIKKFWEDAGVATIDTDNGKLINKSDAMTSLIALIDEDLEEGDIDGKYINEINMGRLWRAHVAALELFKPTAKKIEFMPPRSKFSYVDTVFYCEGIDIDSVKKKASFNELLKAVDSLSINPLNSVTTAITYIVKDVWVE